MSKIELHPDRLLPADPAVRSLASRFYEEIRHLPIVSAHGHIDPVLLADDVPFTDPASLLVTPDHYVTRLLHAHGVDLARLGLAHGDGGEQPSPREVWRLLCEHWWAFRGTPSRYWLEAELAEVFGVFTRPTPEAADALYDQLTDKLATPEFRPRALFRRFGVEVLATTDDPCSDLDAHRRLAADPGWNGRVIPTFRPDRYLDPAAADWTQRVADLGRAADKDTGHYEGYLAALEARRAYFIAHGATATDHGPADAGSEPLTDPQARRIYTAALNGTATVAEQTAFRRHMLSEMARMSCDDGLVMQLHPAVLRNHHRATSEVFGPDTGHDIPLAVEFTQALRPLLERYGTHPRFRMVLFTVDETTWSRELAPLAGFYPSVFLGAPWWFLDTPGAMRRFREAVTDTAGIHKTAGFVDDTRAFCSIPARHDMARRVDCGFLANLVATHVLPEDEALQSAHDLTYRLPKDVFRLS
ncbi:MAG: glucuronate isomerase [Streptomyces sp.]|uniref:glucuronate isomerase n=1 Tax=Streptomyces sp. TaxID=1931 RepID=UPI003D6C2CBF